MPYFGIYGLEFLEKLWYLKWAISILTNCKILRKEKKRKKRKKNLGPKIQNLRISRLAFSKNYIVIFEIRTLKFLLVESLAK